MLIGGVLAACQTKSTDVASFQATEEKAAYVDVDSYNIQLIEIYAKQNLDLKPITEKIKGKLYKPSGNGPFPGVVVFHGCGGASDNEWMWAEWFQEKGVVALVVDGFSPRGIQTTCSDLQSIKASTRINDAFGGAAFLGKLPLVDDTNIGIMGFSNGAGRALNVVAKRYREKAGVAVPNFRFSIPVYPECRAGYGINSSGYRTGPYGAPVMVLIGESDDWTLASSCLKVSELTKNDAYPVKVITYPGAHHGFDHQNQSAKYLPNADNWNNVSGRGATVQGDRKTTLQAMTDVLAFLRKLGVIR